ncbi:MAG: transglycosylase SLT domain-containing protein [Bacteroidia bacterium]
MKIYLSLVFAVLFFSANAQGPNPNKYTPLANDVKSVQEQLDSIVTHYFVKKSIEQKRTVTKELDSLFIPEFTDSVIEYRLSEIHSYIPLDFNNKTKAFINLYTRKRRELVPYILALSDYYFPIFEAELDKQGLPLELKYLPVIESALKPRAVSKAGAVGLWQFMYSTGKMHGLTINSYVDERKDPLKATKAACDYLAAAYKMFGDWQLAIAAYNCGPGNVNKAIRRSGGKTNFWEIYNYLPRETRGYVPAFIAAVYFFHHHEDHNIGIDELTLPRVIDTVNIDGYMHLADVATELNLDLGLVQELNPQYKVNIIPASKNKPYTIILPFNKALLFTDHVDTLYAQYELRKGTRTTSPVSYTSSSYSVAGKTAIYYTVKSGDNLGFIADWYDTYVSSLKSWNGLYSTRIRIGQKIKVFVPNEKVDYYSAVNGMSNLQKKNIAANVGSSKTTKSTSATITSGNYMYYTFKSGDTLWDLSQKFPGNSITSIMNLNGISNAKSLKPGQKIKLKKMQ